MWSDKAHPSPALSSGLRSISRQLQDVALQHALLPAPQVAWPQGFWCISFQLVPDTAWAKSGGPCRNTPKRSIRSSVWPGAQEFKLVSDTLFLGVSCIDRFLSIQHVSRSQLQLVGITCMFLASKYEEIYAPTVCPLPSSARYALMANGMSHILAIMAEVVKGL